MHSQLVTNLNLDLAEFEGLRQQALSITKSNFGNKVYVRGLIEFSNYCHCSCKYCGLRVQNSQLQRFRLGIVEILSCIEEAYKIGYRSFVLQSGEDSFYTAEYIVDLIRQIKGVVPDVAITLGVGERPFEQYAQFKEAGADRFLIKHECADAKLYNQLHPHSSFKNRLQCLVNLKKLRYQTGSGFMIGLPSQSVDTIARDIRLLKRLDVEMAGIGPFIPHPQTPLKGKNSVLQENNSGEEETVLQGNNFAEVETVLQGNNFGEAETVLQGNNSCEAETVLLENNFGEAETVLQENNFCKAEMTLKAVALTRLLLPQSMLPVTTSLGVINPAMKSLCLEYGANVVMQKLEPPHFRKLYELYPKEVVNVSTMNEEKEILESWLADCGRRAVFGRGDHIRYERESKGYYG